MKYVLLALTAAALLSSSGCVFFGPRDHGDNRDRDARHERHDAPNAGVDHGEHPGDLEHGDTMQR